MHAHNILRPFFITAALTAIFATPSQAVVSIGHVEINGSTGQFLTSAGAALTTGGLTVGYFSLAAPTTAQWLTLDSEPISTAYSSLTDPSGSYRFVDIRNISGATQSGLNWNFSGGSIAGTVQNISTPFLSAGTELYVMAFDSGNQANSFSGATTWGVATSTASSWLSPSDGFGTSLVLNQVTSTGVPVGTKNGNNIQLATPVPEPSVCLSVLGGVVLLGGLRRQRKSFERRNRL